MDVSSSQDKFNKQHISDVGKFVSSAIETRDRVLLICFGDHIRVVSDFNRSPREMIDATSAFEKGDRKFPELDPDDTRDAGTALFDSLYAVATQKLNDSERERRAIVVFSDGEDNSSAHDLLDAIEAAQSADAPIYTVRYTEARRGRLTSRNRYGRWIASRRKPAAPPSTHRRPMWLPRCDRLPKSCGRCMTSGTPAPTLPAFPDFARSRYESNVPA